MSYEMDAVRPDGSPGWEQWTDRALFDAQGRVVEYQSVGRDVTGAAGRGGDRAPARGAAPEREAGGAGLAARRGRARAQQPARRWWSATPSMLRGDGADAPTKRARRAASTRRPSAAPGSSRPSSPWRARSRRSARPVDLNRGGPRRAGAAGLRPAHGRRRRSCVELAPGLPPVLGDADQLAPGGGQPRRQRAAGAGAERRRRAGCELAPLRAERRHGRARGRGQRPRRAGGRPQRASSSPSSPPSRRAWAPASASRSATASSAAHGGRIEVETPRRPGARFRSSCRWRRRCRPALRRRWRRPSRRRAAGCWWSTTRRDRGACRRDAGGGRLRGRGR